MNLVHSLRLIASFALLGAVLFGIAVGWVDNQPFDLRWIGAGLGAIAAVVVQAVNSV